MELLSSDKFKGNIYTRGGEAGGAGGHIAPTFSSTPKIPPFFYIRKVPDFISDKCPFLFLIGARSTFL